MDTTSQLILILTHRCNLACRCCNIKKDKKNMPLDTAVEALSFFFKKNTSIAPSIKFFGGEPLLEFQLIKKVHTYAKRWLKNIRFEITTNGIALNNKIIEFLAGNHDIELWYSPHGTLLKITDLLLKKLPDCGINILITPPKAKNLSDEFAFLWRLGFRKFNFLPAYFNYWNKEDLNILNNEFSITANSIKDLIRLGNKINIKNLKTLSPTPLFNNGIVVDCNGDVFLNNMFLSKHFTHLRPDLKIGHIGQADRIDWRRRTNFDLLFNKYLDSDIYAATMNADRILTDFVASLKQ